MCVHHGYPKVIIHVCEGFVAQDTSVVDQDVDASVVVNGSLYNTVAILAAELRWYCFTTGLADFIDNIIGVGEIVDDNLCAKFREKETVAAAKTT